MPRKRTISQKKKRPPLQKSGLPLLIGVVHIPPLPGSPQNQYNDSYSALQFAGHTALQEAELLQKSGFQGIIIENFGDAPFYKSKVPPETIASMSVIATAMKELCKIPVGINLLRNDPFSALAISTISGCSFIRANVLGGVVATDQGLIEGCAAELLRERRRLLSQVKIFADVHVKHGKTLSSDHIDIAIEDAVLRSGADAVILSGLATGRAIPINILDRLRPVISAVGKPVYIGSGVSTELIPEIRELGCGIIVSSALRKGGKAGAPLDRKKVQNFAKQYLKNL